MPSKLESLSTASSPGGISRHGWGKDVTALMLVKQPNYVPPGVAVRARVSDVLFTCSFGTEKLPELERDDLIQTISLPQPLRPAERPDKGASRWQLLRLALDHLASVVARERATLSAAEHKVITAWLCGTKAEAIAASTGRSPAEIQHITLLFRFRPAIWEAILQAHHALGSEDISRLVGVADLRDQEVLLLDTRDRP